ncbi:MAG: hypothetical protein ACRDQH_06750 [Pseudonocardiaceae bacterium]
MQVRDGGTLPQPTPKLDGTLVDRDAGFALWARRIGVLGLGHILLG